MAKSRLRFKNENDTNRVLFKQSFFLEFTIRYCSAWFKLLRRRTTNGSDGSDGGGGGGGGFQTENG